MTWLPAERSCTINRILLTVTSILTVVPFVFGHTTGRQTGTASVASAISIITAGSQGSGAQPELMKLGQESGQAAGVEGPFRYMWVRPGAGWQALSSRNAPSKFQGQVISGNRRADTRRRSKRRRAPHKLIPACLAPSVQQLRTILYFGLARPAGTVSEAEWEAFVRDEVTPRFPEGLTAWEVDGQWRRADGKIIRERSKVLLLVHADTPTARARIEALIARYKGSFEQESVLWETIPVCVMF